MKVVATSSAAEPKKPRRRWFQFRLRTLLIGTALLAIPCHYIGLQAKIVRERKTWVLAHSETAAYAIRHRLCGIGFVRISGRPNQEPSLARRWLGDELHDEIWLNYPTSIAEDELEDDLQAVRVLFPEATMNVLFDSIDNHWARKNGCESIKK